jgi:hypothetical protein
VSSCPGVTQIWVAAGTYKPTDGTDRAATFELVNGIRVYGRFAGTETDRSERDWVANPTILSGDIGVAADTTDNCYHVVTNTGNDSTTVFDGFTVTGGHATGSQESGGGMGNNHSDPLVVNTVFKRLDTRRYHG